MPSAQDGRMSSSRLDPGGCYGTIFRGMNSAKVLLVITALSLTLNFAFYISSSSSSSSETQRERIISCPDIRASISEVSEKLANIRSAIENPALRRVVETQQQKLNSVLVTLGGQRVTLGHQKVDNRISAQNRRDVCPEKYAFKDLQGDYPVYYKGFETESCADAPEFHTTLTLTYNFVHYDSADLGRVSTLIREVNRLYPVLNMIAAIPPTLKLKAKNFSNTVFVSTAVSEPEPNIWNQLIGKVKTKYVYIGRNVVHFTRFDRLERLVRQINGLNTRVVAGSFRTLNSGQWSNGCDQSRLFHYNLEYRHGYSTSREECIFCHHVHGPFVAKVDIFKKNLLPVKMTAVSSFALWFLKIKNFGDVVSCPDSMSFVTDKSRQPTTKEDWKDLARSLQVERIYPHPGQLIEFSCAEANVKCSVVKGRNLALSYCCKKELADGIKLVMDKCQEGGMICEAQAGTLLGLVKFNNVLPWELDADIKIMYENFTAFREKFGPHFSSLGYKWKTGHGATWHYYELYTSPSSWKIEIYTYRKTEMGLLTLKDFSPTVADFDGNYVRVPESPGLFSRNCYGEEIYQHVQHYSQIGIDSKTFYGEKHFKKCSTPGRHYCLDKFSVDGNVMFNYPLT